MPDAQGDKAVVDYLRRMGAQIEHDPETGNLRLSRAQLRGAELDLNATPDALPAMAVAAALASGTTHLTNVPQARLKETDRIASWPRNSPDGSRNRRRPDGLVIQGTDGGLRWAFVARHETIAWSWP
jgi:3-phosphoshikimate 1-carboxyvinyltransferase